jgi:hypothetical protein
MSDFLQYQMENNCKQLECLPWTTIESCEQDFQLASNVTQAGPVVYGAFDSSWQPVMPVFESHGTMEYCLIHLFLSYLYCE